jgi:hypothetical protein
VPHKERNRVTYLHFETHALPILIEMSLGVTDDPGDYLLQNRLIDQGMSKAQADDLALKLIDDEYISVHSQPDHLPGGLLLNDPRITPKALKMLRLWPDDHEQALYIMGQLADHFDDVATTATDESKASGARHVASWLRELSIEVAAAVVAKAAGLSG